MSDNVTLIVIFLFNDMSIRMLSVVGFGVTLKLVTAAGKWVSDMITEIPDD